MSLISLERVGKSFAGTGEVVRPLDLEIPEGQFVSFLGPSGCGKSTLLRIIAGLEAADQGTVRREKAARVSFVFQEPLLLPWRTALQNVQLPLELEPNSMSNAATAEAAREILTRVGLADAVEKMPHQLSGGMKMRVSLARALVTKPEILLLDEPFSALDEITRFQLQEDLRAFWQRSLSTSSKLTIIFVTHSMSEAAFLADRQIVFSSRPARIVADRASKLSSLRTTSTRHSAEFAASLASEVQELQAGFRS